MSDKPPSKTIFIGNIPYQLSEEQVIQLLSSAGQVLSFRLVTDSDTGRPKGYGFAEFADADAAASAVRNLDSYSIMGRQLRVDFSHKDNSGGGGGGGQRDGANNNMPNAGQEVPVNVTAVPPGVPLPPGVSCPDAISQTLAQIGAAQLLDILSQFKGVVTASPESATELLRQQPQLAYAIFQCLVTMGLVDAAMIQSVIDSTGLPAVAPAPVPQVATIATPPVNPMMAYKPPPPQPPPPMMNPTPQPGLGPEQMQAIRSLLTMPPEQYQALGPAEKSQIDMLRAQYGHMVR